MDSSGAIFFGVYETEEDDPMWDAVRDVLEDNLPGEEPAAIRAFCRQKGVKMLFFGDEPNTWCALSVFSIEFDGSMSVRQLNFAHREAIYEPHPGWRNDLDAVIELLGLEGHCSDPGWYAATSSE